MGEVNVIAPVCYKSKADFPTTNCIIVGNVIRIVDDKQRGDSKAKGTVVLKNVQIHVTSFKICVTSFQICVTSFTNGPLPVCSKLHNEHRREVDF